ncbi:hypothetical protein AGDE_15120 [Angomonas deanei]|nr:hypothetical protein AGDE_15120 [Angomonas deanei]|eukprot:EPY19658.1 hypothetical protein AGDE_15120 [Angomonas deanei]
MTDTEHDTMIATACADLWRVFFQYCGVLPCGSACPESILGWIDHMPLYLIEDEGKTAILRVYSTLANRKTLILKPVMRENVLQSSSILIRKMTQTTPSSDTKESGHTHYDATNMGAVSEIVKPIFATKSRGSEPSEDGQGPRRDFFELCASESTDQFLPTIDITNSIQVRVHNGDLSEVADPSEAKQYAGQQCAILLVQWKKRPDHYTVIRAGDVLGVEMVDKKLDVPIPQINEKRLSVSAANAHDIEKFSPAPASTNAGEKGEKDSRLSLSDTSELFCKDEQATTDRPNPNVRRASSRRSSVEVINPPLDGEKVITSATVSGGLNTQSTYNFQVTHVLRSTRENQQVVLLSLTGTYMTFFNDYIITTLYHYRRAHPPFCIEKTRRYAWTNPQFKCLSPTESVRDGVVSSYADIPYALGWLIGNSIGNGVVFQAPIPPLAFRVLSRSLKYDQSIAQIRPTPFDLNLICEKWTAEALHLVLMNPQAVMLGVGLPPDTPITRKTIHATLDRLVRELIFNIQDSEEHTTFFWEEVARGLRHTSLAKTPLFRHCCARTLRAILCGRVDNARRSFSFKDHFLIAFDDTVAYMPYTKKICKWTLECLETYFNTEEKRLILRFITGRSLLPSKMKSEVIHINFTSLQMQSLDEFSSLSLRLPTSNTCDSTLNIPNYLEILLVSPKSRYASSFLLDGGRKKKLRVVLPSDYQAAWELLTEAELKTLKKEYTTILATRLLTSVYETNGFTDDLTTPVERVRTAPHRKSTPEENPAQATSVLSQASNNADFPVYLKGFNGIKAGTHPSALQELRSVSILAMMAHVEESMLLTTPLMSQMLSPQMADLPAGAQELPPTSPNARSMQRNDSETSVDKEPEFGFYRLIREAEKQSTDGFDKKLTDRQQYINMIDVDSSEREKERLMKESSMQHGGPPAPPPLAEKPQPPAKAEPPKVQHFHNTAAFEFDLETSDILPSPKAQVAEVLQVGPPPPPPVAPKKPTPSRHKMPESIRRLQEQLSKETDGRKEGEVKVGFTSDVQKKKSVDAQIEQLFPDL